MDSFFCAEKLSVMELQDIGILNNITTNILVMPISHYDNEFWDANDD